MTCIARNNYEFIILIRYSKIFSLREMKMFVGINSCVSVFVFKMITAGTSAYVHNVRMLWLCIMWTSNKFTIYSVCHNECQSSTVLRFISLFLSLENGCLLPLVVAGSVKDQNLKCKLNLKFEI